MDWRRSIRHLRDAVQRSCLCSAVQSLSGVHEESKHPLSFGLFADTIWNGGFNFQSRRFFAFTQTYDEFSGDENSLMEEFPSSILRYFSKNGNKKELILCYGGVL